MVMLSVKKVVLSDLALSAMDNSLLVNGDLLDLVLLSLRM